VSKKWKMLAARFAAEKSREMAQKTSSRTPQYAVVDAGKVVNYRQSDLLPEFPLLISVAKAHALVVDELSGGDNYLPWRDVIPAQFFSDHNSARHIITQWFFHGMTEQIQESLASKVGIEPHAALRIIRYTMTSRTSEHNHKMAGCAYLLNAWFEIESHG